MEKRICLVLEIEYLTMVFDEVHVQRLEERIPSVLHPFSVRGRSLESDRRALLQFWADCQA